MALDVWTLGTGTTGLGVATTITVTLTDSAAVGELVSGWATVQSSGTINSVADTGGNTWTIRSAYVSGTVKYYWIDCVLTTALNIGDTITVTCSTAANRKLAIFFGISGQAASPFDKQGVGSSGTSTTPSIAVDGPSQADSVILCGLYWGLTTLATEDPDYVWQMDAVVENRHMHGAYRIVSSTASDTYSPTLTASQAWDVNYIIYKADSAPPGIDDEPFCLFGVG